MTPAGPDVVVIGGGAAGLFAAASAATAGAKVLLLEKTSRIGTKILISGGGKCNIAHAGPLEDVIKAFPAHEAIFIRPSCYRMTNSQIMEVFEKEGLELYARPDGRVFPAAGTAKDVVHILVSMVALLGVQICMNSAVTRVVIEEGEIRGVEVQTTERPVRISEKVAVSGFGAKALLRQVFQTTADQGEPWLGPSFIECEHAVIACGGSSYPNSGTTGDGWKWAKDVGHSVVKPRPALAPIYLVNPKEDFSGVSVQSCGLTVRAHGKKAQTEVGDLLFTHVGVSGPVVLQISRHVALLLESNPVSLEIDLQPYMSFERILKQLNAACDSRHKQTIGEWLLGYGNHNRLIDAILEICGVSRTRPLDQLGKKNRIRIVETLKAWPIGEVRTVPLERGEVTAGGIDLGEVDPKTMRSRIVKGLYLAGEVLDIAGPVGGYNLQAAFATGHVAGETAAVDAMMGL